ncbi:LysE family transporter [Beggiatoa leptomitoformis]|uniref:LysE family transporter n=1 Tax=Beggiatoa leptomitoformis TaxID=288004 RepID=A0A2N9YFX8_9GAMM|nr:LysE family transporter [Beggiatoa leptomitoformis]ALG68287.1 LysE family transporter [Beggiatoa leptomitoformis]AUI69402.1 LysE family transporter [Beggiatoa leptomitoformis]
MALEIWVAYFLACLVLSLSPGAGVVFVMSSAMSYGVRNTLYGIVGMELSLLIYLLLVAFGIGAIMAASANMFSVIKWSGVIYLLYLGIQKWCEPVHIQMDTVLTANSRPLKIFLQGLFVNLTNPKSIVFLAALLPQFVDLHRSQLLQFSILGITMVVLDSIIMFAYVLMANTLRHLLHDPRFIKLQNRLFGGVLIGAGLLMTQINR